METQTVKLRAHVAKTERQICMKICQQINTPRSLTVWLLLEHNQFEDYLALDINPEWYDDPHAFSDDYLVTEMLRKSVAQNTTYDLEQVAYAKWIEAEELCRSTNERLESWVFSGIPPEPKVARIIGLAVDLCHKILGSVTKATLQKIEEFMDFGPGATTSVGGAITRGRKFTNPLPTTTSALLSFGMFCLPHMWKSNVQGFSVQEHNRLTFVPKNARTHRAITIENDLNIFVQKGIGRMIRQRLSNIGVNLDNQWRFHHKLVAQATSLGLSTIDLSSASDTLSFQTVKLFIPDDWFDLLTWARPEKTEYKGTLHNLEKFSGMGNGYTFELETLIFWCLLEATRRFIGCSNYVSAFGDDMICSNDVHQHVLTTLDYLGFKVNQEKTFGSGRFHESCGCDYFDNVPVRPFYLRWGDFNVEKELYLYQYCNRIRRYASNRNHGTSCDARFLPAWLTCITKIAADRRFYVPDWDYESGGIVGNFDEAVPCLERHSDWHENARRNGWCGYRFTTLHRRPVKTQRFKLGAYVSATKSSSEFSNGFEPLRGRTSEAKPRLAYTLVWPDYGPWI